VIAAALVERCPAASVILATSVDHADSLGVPEGVDLVRLPAMRKVGNGHYAPRRLTISAPDLTALRAGILAAAVESYRPSVLLVDKHPLGLGGELRSAVARLRLHGGRAVLGLRDVLDDPTVPGGTWTAEETAFALEHYPRVLVYGSESVIDTLRISALPPELGPRSHYCGHVTLPVSGDSRAAGSIRGFGGAPSSHPTVLATAGGGEDGRRVLETFVDASADADWEGIAVTGPQLSAADSVKLRKRAYAVGVAVRTFVPELAGWFSAVDAVVSMGGYNTIAEALVRGTPTVCVPRTVPRREQLIRARALAAHGLLQVVEPDRLDAAMLRREIEIALGRSRLAIARKAHALLRFDGAVTAAECLLEEAAMSRVREAA
jgi:predicted glycosyltransferase